MNRPPQPPKTPLPSLLAIRERALRHFGRRPCLWQIRAVEAILRHDQDVVCIAATGSGKTLTFWMPLLFSDGIQVVITPLNLLGDQNVSDLAKAGIKAIAINSDTDTASNFKDIEDLKYRVVITNIELALKDGGRFEKLWKNQGFASRIISIIWDEAHCISKWGDFRPEYKDAARLRYLLPPGVRYFIVSATLPPLVLNDVMDILQIRKDKAHIIHRSNDRPNVYIVVREMLYPMNSFRDLDFLIPKDLKPGDKPPKFLIFFDNKADSIEAAKYLRGRLPPELRGMVKWFNADMSPTFRVDESDALKEGHTWGLACTDSFGMGIDLSDIDLIIQWRATCDLCTLWQRFGRGARNPSLEAIALFLVEPKYFDENREKKAERKAKKEDSKKRKAAIADIPTGARASKKTRTSLVTSKTRTTSPSSAGPPTSEQIPASVAMERARSTTPTAAAAAKAKDVTVPEAKARNEERRGQYSKMVSDGDNRHRKGKGKGDGEIESALDDMINAGTRVGLSCSRLPATLYFGNDITVSDDHLECNTDSPEGCQRCIVSPSPICCELCTPAHFTDFARVHYEKPRQAQNRSRIDRSYTATSRDMSLRDDLDSFREQKTISEFGQACFNDYGPGDVMTDEVLQNIVDFAHHQKLATKEDLTRETKWSGVSIYGDDILRLIAKHHPLPPSVAPLQPHLGPGAVNNASPSTGPSEVAPVKTKRVNSCKACGTPGHISSNRLCPKHPNNMPRSQGSSTSLAQASSENSGSHHDENLKPSSRPDTPAAQPTNGSNEPSGKSFDPISMQAIPPARFYSSSS